MNTPRQSLDLSNVQLDFNQYSASAIIEEDEEEHEHQHTPPSTLAIDPHPTQSTVPNTATAYDIGDDATAHDNDVEEVVIDDGDDDDDVDDDDGEESPESDESVPNPDQPKRKFLFAIVEEDEEEEEEIL